MEIDKQIKEWQCHSSTTESVSVFLNKTHNLLCERMELESVFNQAYFLERNFEELKSDNYEFYKEINNNYDQSYANPRYTRQFLDGKYADIASSLYYELITSVQLIFQGKHKLFNLLKYKFLILAEAMENNQDAYLKLEELYETYQIEIELDALNENYNPENYCTKIVEESDLSDLRYLFKYGIYISEIEISFAQLMNNCDASFIEKLANQMVTCYLKGFGRHNKNMGSRTNARIVMIVGLEKLARKMQLLLSTKKYIGFVGALVYKNIPQQVSNDYAVSSKIDYSKHHYKMTVDHYAHALKAMSEELSLYQGNLIMVCFGQVRTECKPLESYLKNRSDEFKKAEIEKRMLFEQYVPKSEVSYTGMAFPVSEISDTNYKEIFDAIMSINMMESSKHEQMQEHLITILDNGEYVTVEGFKGNTTKLKITLPKLKNPEIETNFVNCGADVNIPAGEVYTSPSLGGSEGLIHLQQIRLAKIQFKNVKIKIKDGFAYDYKYDGQGTVNVLKEQIFRNHDQLPIGEFALGTNTYAYALSKEYGVLHALHTLIYEKLGLHIALGDTCFAWAEDAPLFALNGKKVMAKDNEFSIKRKKDTSAAYVNLHYDLTIPYDEIVSITVHTRNGEQIDVVRNGKFVIDELSPLNCYL